MAEHWVSELYGYKVEKREIRRPGGKLYFFNSHTQVGVLHTTEGGDSVDGAYSTLAKSFSAPHFIIGPGRIIQCRPLTVQGAALRGQAPYFANAQASIQIEICANSQAKLWLPRAETVDALAAVIAYCAGNGIDIPLRVPYPDWPDDVSDMKLPWAVEKTARRARTAKDNFKAKGWYEHLEIPGNNHYDCGAMRRTEILSLAQQLL